MKKILVVDDSALMRRVLCDIINSDRRFQVEDTAVNGLEAYELLRKKRYDAVVLDINMPRMTGLQLLKKMQDTKIKANVLMASTLTREGAKETMLALELGALDFIHKPNAAMSARKDDFKTEFLRLLSIVSRPDVGLARDIRRMTQAAGVKSASRRTSPAVPLRPITNAEKGKGSKIVALASSTGGPKALQSVIPRLPANLNSAVLIVQHMPAGFTKSLAERLDASSEISVKEAEDGEMIQAGQVYIAPGGVHMEVRRRGSSYCIKFTDEPAREGVKPCANYMYESLTDSNFDEIVCVVLTGMGADGTKGILNLENKKKVYVIAQNEETCAVYGMPKSIVATGLANSIVPLEQVADVVTKNVGVQ